MNCKQANENISIKEVMESFFSIPKQRTSENSLLLCYQSTRTKAKFISELCEKYCL